MFPVDHIDQIECSDHSYLISAHLNAREQITFVSDFRHSLVDCVDKTPDYVEKYNKKYNSLRTVYLNSGKVLTLKMNFFQTLHEPCHTRRSKILIPVFT